MSEEEEWINDVKSNKDKCFELYNTLGIPEDEKEKFMRSCENYAIQTGNEPTVENYLEWRSAFKEQLADLEEPSKPPTDTEKERFKEILLEACLISPESVPDPKLRRKMQEACNALIINSWEMFEDPDLDVLMCAFQTADIQDEAKRKELDLLCIVEMGESGNDAEKKLAAVHNFCAFSRSKILPEVEEIFLTTKDPMKIKRILEVLWKEKNLPFIIKQKYLKYIKTNPAAKKIEEEKKRKSSGYWEDFNNVKKELQQIIDMEIRDEKGVLVKGAGVFPRREHLRMINRTDIESGIAKYHGGLAAVKAKMGYVKLGRELGRKPKGYWEDFNNVKKELQPIIDMEIRDEKGHLVKSAGVFPIYEDFILINRQDIIAGIAKHHIGFEAVREKMGYSGIDFSSYGGYHYRRGVKSQKAVVEVLEKFCDVFGFPCKSGETEVGPHRLLEFQCGKDKVIGADITNTNTEWVVRRKWEEREYQKYVDILWIIVLSNKWDEKQYEVWNRESPDNVYVINGRYLEEFLNSLGFVESEFKIPQAKKELIEALSRCTFYNKEKILKEYKAYLESKKQKSISEFLEK